MACREWIAWLSLCGFFPATVDAVALILCWYVSTESVYLLLFHVVAGLWMALAVTYCWDKLTTEGDNACIVALQRLSLGRPAAILHGVFCLGMLAAMCVIWAGENEDVDNNSAGVKVEVRGYFAACASAAGANVLWYFVMCPTFPLEYAIPRRYRGKRKIPVYSPLLEDPNQEYVAEAV